MTMRVPVRETAQGASFLVRVMPRASRTAIVGVMGDGKDAAVKIALQAPPVEGRANAALIEYLAELLDTPRSAIAIASGETARTKRVAVRGRDAMEVATAIAIALTQ
jgi:hypothetical protein